jgi:hypothetical protein
LDRPRLFKVKIAAGAHKTVASRNGPVVGEGPGMGADIYRVLVEARPVGQGRQTGATGHGVISVTLGAADARSAQHQALALLPSLGWTPMGPAVRVSNLTRLLLDSAGDASDSAFGDHARQWLQVAHDEAIREGSSSHLLSVDYAYLDQPQRLPAFGQL